MIIIYLLRILGRVGFLFYFLFIISSFYGCESSIDSSNGYRCDESVGAMGKLYYGDSFPDFSLTDVSSNKIINSDELKDHDMTAVVFVSLSCPFANLWEDTLISYAKEFSHAVRMIAINPHSGIYPVESPKRMKIRAKRKSYPYPFLADPRQVASRAFGASVTPHIFIFHCDEGLVYNGIIGKDPLSENNILKDVTTSFLSESLYTEPSSIKPLGCVITYPCS